MHKRRNIRRILRRLFIIGLVCFGLGVLLIVGVFAYYAKDLPDPQEVLNGPIAQSTKIYDRTGTILLYDVHGEEKRTVIPFSDIPLVMRNAVIAAEDANFYHHFGIDIKGIARAIFEDVLHRSANEGASTITQQFIKNAILTSERTVPRKIKEIILAIEMEQRYSKDQILDFYLNEIPFGSNAYGVEAASQTFFGKHARDLTTPEAATLAALIKAPSYLSPYGSHPEDLAARRKYVLKRMDDLGFITDRQRDAALSATLTYQPQSTQIKAPHFVFYVRDYLENKYGKDAVENGGLKVITTLNWPLQKEAEKIVAGRAATNEKRYGAGNAASISIDPQTGQILSMVGSRDYFDITHDGNVNVTTRLRQPGSSFKPIAYATAFAKGYTPDTVLFDLSTVFTTASGQSYIPNDFDGKFRGPVTMRQALAQSLNIPAVKTLYLAGINNTINTAERMGISSLKDRGRFDLALVLGGAEVSPLEMADAYAVFADDGTYHPPVAILNVQDAAGSTLETYQNKPEQALDPQTARLITSILSDNAARTPAFGAHSPLILPDRPVAAKTGTTQKFRDGWTIGYTPQLSTAVWAGNNDGSYMYKGADGVVVAGPIWHDIMMAGLKNTPPQVFPQPQPITTDKSILNGDWSSDVTVKVDEISGQLASDLTPPELIKKETYKEVHSLLYWVKKDDPRGPVPTPEERDPAYSAWEPPVREWIALQPDAYLYNQPPPTQTDSIHTAANKPTVSITAPASGSTFNASASVTVNVSASAPLGMKQVDFYYDGDLIDTDSTMPFSITFVPAKTNNPEDGSHTISVKAYDKVINENGVWVNIFVNGLKQSGGPYNAGNSNASVILEPPAKTSFPVTLTAYVNNVTGIIQNVSFYYSPDQTLTKAFKITDASAKNINTYQAIWQKPGTPSGGSIVYLYAEVRFTNGAVFRSSSRSFTVPD